MKPYLLLILLALYQLAGCQPVKDKKQPQEFSCPTEGFCIQDSLLFYNGKKIELSVYINSLVPVLGNYDRVIEDKWGDLTNTDWYWFKEKANEKYKKYFRVYLFLQDGDTNGVAKEVGARKIKVFVWYTEPEGWKPLHTRLCTPWGYTIVLTTIVNIPLSYIIPIT